LLPIGHKNYRTLSTIHYRTINVIVWSKFGRTLELISTEAMMVFSRPY